MLRHPALLGRVPSDRFPFVCALIEVLRLLAGLGFTSFPSFRCTVPKERRRRDLPAFQESLVYVPCSLTSAESVRFPAADVVFRLPDGVDLDDFFTRLNHTARTLAVYASPWGRPCGARLASGCTFGLGRTGLLPAGFLSEVSTHGILLSWR